MERAFIHQALRQAVDRGLITRQQLRNAQLSETARKMSKMHCGAAVVAIPTTYATGEPFRRALEERLKSMTQTEQIRI